MTDFLRCALIQQHNTDNIADNRARLNEKIRQAAGRGARLVVLQELHDSLYFCQSENVELCNLAIDPKGENMELYSRAARETGVVLVTSIAELRDFITTRPLSLTATARWPGNTARCTFPTIRLIMRNSISLRATLVFTP